MGISTQRRPSPEGGDIGLTLEYPDREYAFCAPGCQTKFAKDPKAFIPKVEAWLARRGDEAHATVAAHAHAPNEALPQIDAGIRAWYESCRCCLSDAYPQVVEKLDAERDAAKSPAADAGICETAEAHTES